MGEAFGMRSQKCALDAAVKRLSTQRGYILGNTVFICGLVDMTREMGGFLSSRCARRSQQKKNRQLADAETAEKLRRDSQIAEAEQLRRKRARDFKDLKRQLVELEAAQDDKCWFEMTEDDEARLDIVANIRRKIVELEDGEGSAPEKGQSA